MSEKDDSKSISQSGAPSVGERVGYKKPPVQHRFAPGQSGNPKGSSRRRRDAAATGRYLSNPAQAALLAEADRVVTVRENGRSVQLTMREVIARRLMLDASKGGAMAMRLAIQSLAAAEAAKRKEVEGNAELMIHMKMDGEAALKRAKAAGQEPPLLLPHPADIEVDPYTLAISINGPINEQEYDHFNYIAMFRDKMLSEIENLQALDRKTTAQKKRLTQLPKIVARTEALLPPSRKMKA